MADQNEQQKQQGPNYSGIARGLYKYRKRARKVAAVAANPEIIVVIVIPFFFLSLFFMMFGFFGGGVGGTNAADQTATGFGQISGTICGEKSIPPPGVPSFSCPGFTATQPSSDGYYIPTSFGCNTGFSKDPTDNCAPACPTSQIPECNGKTGRECEEAIVWYSANSDQYGCGTKLKVTNPSTGKAVIVRAIDRGPSCSVQSNVRGKFDLSQAARREIGGDLVKVERVDESTLLGPAPACSDLGSGTTKTPSQVLYCQWQTGSNWRDKAYDSGTVASTGCSPTSMAMIFSSYGVTKTPGEIADIFTQQGWAWQNGSGHKGTKAWLAADTAWLSSMGFERAQSDIGYTSNLDLRIVKNYTDKGWLMFAAVEWPGIGGHQVVIQDANPATGQVTVRDPNSCPNGIVTRSSAGLTWYSVVPIRIKQ